MPESKTESKPTKKRRGLWWKVPVCGLVVLLIAFGVFHVVVHQRVVNRLNAIRDAGHPVTLEELDAWYPYPDGPNAAEVYQQAFEAYVGDEEFEWSLPLLGEYVDMPEVGVRMPEEVAERVAYYLEQNKDAIALLVTAGQIDGCRYPIDLTKGLSMELPHLNPAHHGTDLLRLQITMHIDRGEFNAAADKCGTILAMARSMTGAPHYLTSMASISFAAQGLEEVQRVIHAGTVDDDRLQALIGNIHSIELMSTCARGVLSERCIGSDIFQNPYVHLGIDPDDLSQSFITRLWRASGVMDMDHVFYLDFLTTYFELLDNPQWPTPKTHQVLDRVPKMYAISSIILPSLAQYTRGAYQADTLCELAITGIAIERYRQMNGKLPVNLQELVPVYLDAVPTDFFTGESVRYRKVDNGAVVYSPGPDGIDQGGRPYDAKGSPEPYDSDISFLLGLSARKLWPVEKTGQRIGALDEDYGDYLVSDDDVFVEYLDKLEAEGFPKLAPRPLDGRWPSGRYGFEDESDSWDFDFETYELDADSEGGGGDETVE